MTTFPGSPRLIKGGIVVIDSDSAAVQRLIVLQYNPDTLTRTLQVQGAGQDSGDRLEALRLKGPPVETFKVEAEIDAADQLEFPDQNPMVVQYGIAPALSALETLVYPTSSHLQTTNTLAMAGTLELVPMEMPLTLFVWSKTRIVPVRISEFSITEEAFDPSLNPLRAKVSLGLRVLSVSDLGFGHEGGNLFVNYLRQKERLAGMAAAGALGSLGIGGIG